MNRTVSVALAVLFTTGMCAGCSLWDGKPRESRSEYDARMADFFSGVKRIEGNPDSHFLLACYYQDRGRHREAVEEFRKVIAIDPQNAGAYNRLGISYDTLGEFHHAASCYQKALQVDPSLYYVHNNIGYSQILQGDFETAAAALTKALSLNDSNKTIHNNLGLAYARMQRPDLAMPEFEKGGGKAAALRNIARISFEPAGPAPAAPAELTAEEKDLSVFNIALPNLPGKAQESPAAVQGEAGPQLKVKGGSGRPAPGGGVEISNGNGVRLMARHMGRYLKGKGFHVVRFTNAKRFNHKKASIAYRKGYGDEARRLAGELPCSCDLKITENFSRPNVKIKVLIGKEMAPYKKMFKGGGSWS
ncbi:MAG: tetratricopeptide repeat protein [Syntrophaceae bacterium]